eukprot:6476021-Amphidinium_carterae.2
MRALLTLCGPGYGEVLAHHLLVWLCSLRGGLLCVTKQAKAANGDAAASVDAAAEVTMSHLEVEWTEHVRPGKCPAQLGGLTLSAYRMDAHRMDAEQDNMSHQSLKKSNAFKRTGTTTRSMNCHWVSFCLTTIARSCRGCCICKADGQHLYRGGSMGPSGKEQPGLTFPVCAAMLQVALSKTQFED